MSTLCQCGCGQVPAVLTKTNRAMGHVKGQRARFVSGHNLSRLTKPPVEIRFWQKVSGQGVDSCWLWQGATTVNGYGRFVPRRGIWVLSHRWAYEAMRAEIPAGLDMDHLCRTRACVNPWHLEPVTRQVNALRGASTAPKTRQLTKSA